GEICRLVHVLPLVQKQYHRRQVQVQAIRVRGLDPAYEQPLLINHLQLFPNTPPASTLRRLHFFFLQLPPPPRSTLFPYTTLFRSSVKTSASTTTRSPTVRLMGNRPASISGATPSITTRLVPSSRCTSALPSCCITCSAARRGEP